MTFWVLLALFAAYFGLPLLVRRLKGWQLGQHCRGRLVLSYDDGPDPSFTPRLMGVLDELKVRGTFYQLGEKVARESELVRALVAAGHEVASHSFRHVHPWRVFPWTLVSDLERGHATLEALVGPVRGYRPQFGKVVLPSLLWARGRGVRLDWWTVDSGDSAGELLLDRLVERVRAAGGGVVLFHDGVVPGERGRFVLEGTRALVELARTEGWPVVTMGEL